MHSTNQQPAYDPADIAARLRRYIAQHDQVRRDRQELIHRLQDYTFTLRLQNMVAGQLVGRLRRLAVDYDADVMRLANNKRRREAA